MNIQIRTPQKHSDVRGLLVEILRRDEIQRDMMHIYSVIAKLDAVRGNHFHKRKTEWFFIVKGTAKFVLEDNISKERKELILTDKRPTVLEIGPNVSHALKNVGEDELYFIAIVDEVFNPKDPDTFANAILL